MTGKRDKKNLVSPNTKVNHLSDLKILPTVVVGAAATVAVAPVFVPLTCKIGHNTSQIHFFTFSEFFSAHFIFFPVFFYFTFRCC